MKCRLLWLSLLALPVLAAPADIPGWQAYQHHDYLAARQAFAAGAAAGNRVAMFDLAMMNWRGEGGRGAPKDERLAAYWYEQAARQGDVGAQYLIASLYEHGDGVMQDRQRAMAWYARAAAQGDVAARLKAQALSGGPH